MNRTRGFVNLNRFKHSKTVKRLSKFTDEKPKKTRGGIDKGKERRG